MFFSVSSCFSLCPLWFSFSAAWVGAYRPASMQTDLASCSALRCFLRHPGIIQTSMTAFILSNPSS